MDCHAFPFCGPHPAGFKPAARCASGFFSPCIDRKTGTLDTISHFFPVFSNFSGFWKVSSFRIPAKLDPKNSVIRLKAQPASERGLLPVGVGGPLPALARPRKRMDQQPAPQSE
jgi:hypothetical protein